MTASTISTKGWVVIPVELRKKYGLTAGAQVRVVDYGGVLALIPSLENPIQQVVGMLKGDPSLTQVLLEEHVQELVREQ